MITDELREYAQRYKNNAWSGISDDLDQIANRIDEECERRQEDIIDETLGGIMKMTDENMAKNGWIRLPKDADGEYIHVGDVMEGVDKFDSLKKIMGKVITVSFESDGIVDVAIQAWNSDGKSWHRAYLDPNASVYRHHHEPTVEDVLREFSCVLMGKREFDGDVTEVVAEYAQKLQLREES